MDLRDWLTAHEGIAHREVARAAKWSDRAIRAAADAGSIQIIRRTWLSSASAPADLVAAARAGGRVSCFTLARERGWWMPEGVDSGRHLSLSPNARKGVIADGDTVHWAKTVAPASRYSLRASIEDALAHIALCAPTEAARAMWESAVRKERLSLDALRNVQWTTRIAARLADEVSDLSDSGLESIFLTRISPWGLPIRQQVVIASRPVDFLIGERLVVQVDGHAHHSTAADRGRDVLHDAELRLRGFTVLRFTYAQVLHDWPAVQRSIARAVAAGLHRGPRRI